MVTERALYNTKTVRYSTQYTTIMKALFLLFLICFCCLSRTLNAHSGHHVASDVEEMNKQSSHRARASWDKRSERELGNAPLQQPFCKTTMTYADQQIMGRINAEYNDQKRRELVEEFTDYTIQVHFHGRFSWVCVSVRCMRSTTGSCPHNDASLLPLFSLSHHVERNVWSP